MVSGNQQTPAQPTGEVPTVSALQLRRLPQLLPSTRLVDG